MAPTPFDPVRIQHDAGWHCLLTRLPADLESSAFTELALFRHRGVPSAIVLLRLILAYACGWSMPMVTAWASAQRLLTITPEALQYRIKRAHHWLSALALHMLAQRAQVATTFVAAWPYTLRLIDGTATPRPGATGTDWRVHCSLNLRTQTLDDVQLTPETEGESFARFTPHPGDLYCADRNFCTRQGLWHVVCHGADALVRVIWQNLPLQTRAGDTFPLWEHLHTLAPGACGDWEVQTRPLRKEIPAISGRLVALRLPEEAAVRAREHHRKRRQKRGDGPPGAATLEGWSYLLLFTTLPARVPAETVLALYRFRWQIELAIKRYKSLCGLAAVRTTLSTSCQTVLWAKLLLILLLEDLGSTTESFPPSAGGCGPSDQPLALDRPAVADPGRLDSARLVPDPAPGPAPRLGALPH